MTFGERSADRIQALGPILDADHVTQANFVAGNIDAATVHRDVAVANDLPGLGAAQPEAETMHDVVEATFEQDQQRVARVALALRSASKIVTELPLEHAVVMLDLLLFAQVHAVVGELAAALLVHARSRFAAFDCALGRIAA